MTTPHDSFDELHRLRAGAIAALDHLAAAADELRLERRSGQLRELSGRVADDRFRLIFVGGFDAGKSTLVNALLGEALLPTGYAPLTAAVTVIRNGPTRRAWVVRGGVHAEPEPIAFDDLRTVLRIDDEREEPDSVVRVEIEVPSELLSNGIEIVDTPGLDDALVNATTRTSNLVQYLPHSDAVVFVTQVGGAMNARERAFVEDTLRPLGLRDLFIVCTRADQLLELPDEEREEAVARITKSLGGLVPADRLFLVNGLRAFQARIGGERPAPADTGVPALDDSLRQFLSADRGVAKVARASGIGGEAGSELATVVTARRRALDEPDQERDRFEKVLRIVPIMERQRHSVLDTVDGIAAVLEPGAEREAQEFLLGMAARCPRWLDDLPPFATVKWREMHHLNERIQTATNAVSQHFGDHLRRELGAWQEDTFAPYLRRQCADLQSSAEEEMRELFELSAHALRALDNLGPDDEQITSELLAQYFAGVDMRGAIISEARPGVPDVTRTLINRAIAIVAISIIAGGFAIARSIANVVHLAVRVLWREKFEGYVAGVASAKIADELRNRAPGWGKEVRADVAKALAEVRDNLDAGMRSRITDVEQRAASRIAVLEGNRADEIGRLARADELITRARSLLAEGSL